MRLHICPLDKTCRSVGAPARLHVSTQRWHFGIALTPGSKFAGRLDEEPRWTSWQRHPKRGNP